jgi:23S rRNA (pseudouridine1915-N3)-methyltransferase
VKIVLLLTGKTTEPWIRSAIESYEKRLKHYVGFQIEVIPDLKSTKNLTEDQIRTREGEMILSWNRPGDRMILLDERGTDYSSVQFADFMQKMLNAGTRQLVLVVGGAYGFAPEVYAACPERLSLSKMTFSHQMVRIFAVEQLYRAFSILHNSPYHHE